MSRVDVHELMERLDALARDMTNARRLVVGTAHGDDAGKIARLRLVMRLLRLHKAIGMLIISLSEEG